MCGSRIQNRLVLVAVVVTGVAAGLPATVAIEKDGLEFTVSVEKHEFVSGEGVMVLFSWKNTTDRPMSIREWGGPNAGVNVVAKDGKETVPDFAVYGDSGERLKYGGGWVDGLSGEMRLSPGQVVSRSYDVSQSYDLTQPGKYILKAAYLRAVRPGPPETRDYLVHPDVEIVVVEDE